MSEFTRPEQEPKADRHDLLLAALDFLPFAVALFDAEGRILLVHGGLRPLLGDAVPSRDPEPKVDWTLLAADGEPMPPDEWPDERALRGVTEKDGFLGFCRSVDETITPIRFVALPLELAPGQMGGVLLIEDLAARKRAQAELRATIEGRLAKVFAAAIRRAFRDGSLVALLATQGADASERVKDPKARPQETLTQREIDVLRLLAWGFGNKEVAAQLGIGVKTVEFHRARAIEKLGLKGRPDIVRYALRRGWLGMEGDGPGTP